MVPKNLSKKWRIYREYCFSETGGSYLRRIYVPVKKWMYYGYSIGSFREIEGEKVKLLFSQITEFTEQWVADLI